MTLANIIFPAFVAPYFAAVVVPWAGLGALVTEIAIYRRRYPLVDRWWLTRFVVLVNIVSSLAGVGVAMALPSGLSTTGSPLGSFWESLVMAAWVVAFLVSVAIEFPLLFVATRAWKLDRLLQASIWANIASYLVLGAIFLITAWVLK